MRTEHPNRWGLASLVLAVLLLSSCFTTAVWHAEAQGPRNGLPARLALTPFTLILDLLTWPVQEAFWHGHYGHHAHCGCHGH